MKLEDLESPRRVPSTNPSNRLQSPSSSKFKLTGLQSRKNAGKNFSSNIIQQRQAIRIIDNDVDVTPKLLTHSTFSTIDERQMTALETIGMSQTGSASQILPSSSLSSRRRSSSTFVSRSSLPTGSMIADDMQFESLLGTQAYEIRTDDVERAPSQFYLPSIDPNVFPTRPETVTLTINESETFFIYEMQPRTGDLRSAEGQAIQKENDDYEYKTTGPGSTRKLVSAETQTIKVLTKSRGTYLSRKKRKNQGVFVNNWAFHDTFAAPELMTKRNDLLIAHTRESIQRMWQAQEMQSKLPTMEIQKVRRMDEEELTYICQSPNFWNSVRIMERILSNNAFIYRQKRFTGLIKQDPCSLSLEFTYSLDLLWVHDCEINNDRPVSSFCWNYVNTNILAVGYGSKKNSGKKDGLLLIWPAKNPAHPARSYLFNSPVSDLDWSRDRPNLLAVGFYDGEIKVIDVSAQELNVIRQSQRVTCPASSPHWQVKWWPGDEQFDYQEQIYTCDQDGCIYCYRFVEDFTSMILMKIFRIEGTLPGVTRTSHCKAYDILINRRPGALVLRRHPTSSTIYFVGSDEGCIYKCSTNYLYQHIDSFLAHDGPIYSMVFSPFCPKIFLTCGADWCTRIWAEDIMEPLITLTTTMACVRYATWCPTHSTIIVSVVSNEICIWDIRRKVYKPTSVTLSPNKARFVMVDFTANGNQLVVADVEGVVYVYNLEGMPFPPYNQEQVLIESIENSLITKPTLLRKLRKLGPPFSEKKVVD